MRVLYAGKAVTRLSAVLALLVCLGGSAPAVAQESTAAALALIKRYVEYHNSHDIDGVMDLYAKDAVFFLSMGRPEVRGKSAIENLERFDVAAGSTIYPQRLQVERDGDRWRVHIGGAIEHSEIFEATGASIVMAQGMDDAFVLRDGKIMEIHQPELEPACRDIIVPALRRAADWLVAENDTRAAQLVENGFLRLTPETIPRVVVALHDWRAATGVAPDPAAVSSCARFDPVPARPQ